MYAVIRSGGKQHRVVEGEILSLEKIDIAAGDSINFDQVLMVGDGGEVACLGRGSTPGEESSPI